MAFTDLLSRRYDPASAAEIDQLGELVATVPPELVEFLRTSNGGELDPNDVAIATPWGGRHLTLDEFWPVTKRSPAGNSIVQATQALRSEAMLPPTVLAIAGDVASSVICMSCEPDSFGHLYLWDDTRSHPNAPQVNSLADVDDFMAHIANSLVDFGELMTDEAAALAAVAGMETPPAGAPSDPISPNPTSSAKAGWVDPAPITASTATTEVYLYRHSSGQPDVVLPKPLEAARDNSGAPLADTWQVPQVSWHRPDTNTVDLIDAGGLLLLREPARVALGDLLESYGEFLPVDTDTGPLFVFRCLNLVDALDPSVELVEGKRGFVDVSAHEFVADVAAAAAVFTLPQQPTKPKLFFTRPVVDAIEASSVRTLEFTKLWQAGTAD